MKTRVVTVEGAPVRFRHALIRSLLGIVDLLASVGGIAVVSSLLTKRGQRLGDLVAGTMVIREPSQHGPTGAIYFWPASYLAEWSRTVDTRALGNDTYQLVRDFLSNQEMADEARAQVGEDLALLVSQRMPHAARPAAVPVMDYLTAIAAATQDPATAYPPPAPRRSATQPPPPVGQPALYGQGQVQPPPPVGQPALYGQGQVQPPPPVGQPAFYPQGQVQPPPPAAYPVQPPPPAAVEQQPVEPPPPAPNEGGFAAPG